MNAECRDFVDVGRLERELDEARQNLAHADRLAHAGLLLGSILHEIHQPLAAIQLNVAGGLHRLEALPSSPERLRVSEILTEIRDTASFAVEVIDRVRRFSRKQPLERWPVDLNEAIRDVVKLATPEAHRRKVSLRTCLAEDLPEVLGDMVSLQQVALDLIMNGIEAIDSGQRNRCVTVTTCETLSGVEIHVADTGIGVSAEDAGRLFESFFTTKQDGAGLGLAIAHSIVSAHDGEIGFAETDGSGTTFFVRLPWASTQR